MKEIDMFYMDRMMFIISVATGVLFILLGNNADDDVDPSLSELAIFILTNISAIICALYLLYRVFTNWR